MRSAALNPPLIAELIKTHAEASEDALRAYLITRRHFSPESAGRFIVAFRDAVSLAGSTTEGYSDSDKGADAGGGGSQKATVKKPNRLAPHTGELME